MRPRVRTVLILLLTLGLLGFFFRKADPAGVWAETRSADAGLLALALVVTGVTYAMRAWRWQSLLAPIGPTTALRTTIIGFAASSLLPGRPGEVLRPYLLARREGLSPTSAFATIILERLLDLATVLLLFAAFVFMAPAEGGDATASALASVKFWGGVSAVSAVVGLGLLFALAGHPERLGRAALKVERVLPERLAHVVAAFVETFIRGLAVMRRPRRLAAALALSFPLWLSIAAGIWLTSQAFHITFSYTASFLVMAVLVVGVAVPTPGSVGAFHAAYQFTVTTFFQASQDRAVGAAIVLHAISFLPVTLAGIYLLMREGLTLAGARRIARNADGGDVPATPVPAGERGAS